MSDTPCEPCGPVRQPSLPPAYRLVALDSVASTNDEARRLVKEGAEDGTLVWALEQRQGRGRHGRTWASPRGNLYLSLVLRPECDVSSASQLGFVAATALREAIGAVVPPLVEVTVKWPNDVLVNDRKVAGLLLETVLDGDNELEALILGMGVNIDSFPEDTDFPATSLCYEGASLALEPADLLEAFARHFLAWVNRWLDDGFAPVRKAWLSHATGKDESIEVRLPTQTLRGTFRDIDAAGALVLEEPDGGRRSVTVGDVFFAQ